ncbi:MAG TPA: flagellar hook-length control protein FliK [Dongiaceae bacterium]|nr:flagellar hook-length control protein FliK [Dongiaceae bacterium]
MDATQLSLLFTARFQSSAKSSLQLGDDATGADTSFADLLKKRALEQAELQRQIELDRQNWRSQPSSYTPSRTPSTAPTAPSSTDTPRSTGNNDGDKTPRKVNGQNDGAGSQSTQQRASTQNGSARDTSATKDSSEPTSSRKTTKSKDSPTDGDASQVSNGQSAPANANNAGEGKHSSQADQSADDGTSGNGQGQGQGQNPQDDSQQAQQQAGNTNATGLADSVEGTILAGLMMGQAPVGNSATAAPMTGTAQQAAGVNAVGGGTAGAAIAGQIAAQGNTVTDAATQAAAALGTSLPATGAIAAAAPTPAAGLDDAAAAPLPQAAAANAQNKAAAQELASTFATIVAKNAQSAAPNTDNGRISIAKTDTSPQMPKPLVKIDSDHAALATTEPAESVPAEPAPESATVGLDTSFDADDYSSSDLRTFSSYSPLLSGSSLAVGGKQADALTALRQQLAGASVQDQVAIHMQRAIKDSVDKISIQLSPTELGRIHVKMNVDDDKNVTASITVERASTLDLLQRDTKALERALQDAGLKTDSGSLSFSLQRGNQGDSSDTPGWNQGNGRQIGSSGQENSATSAEVSSATAGNEVDTANGLVNVAV